ncbi:MAG TPA: hypothetical protein VIF15_02365 [Polyangiaceae bacterium]|jgi:hypothetical protein
MTLRILRHTGWAALVAAAACATAVACSNNPPAPPDVFMNAQVGTGPSSPSQVCNFGTQQQWLQIGSPTGDKPTTVADGNSQSGGASVHVTCTVGTGGSGFNISLNAVEDGLSGGSVTVTGTVDTTTGGTGLTGVFQSQTNGRYADNNCTLTYMYNGNPVPVSPPVAAGRIWGHVSCPNAKVSGQPVTLPDGGIVDRQCDGEADFLFEQCSN